MTFAGVRTLHRTAQERLREPQLHSHVTDRLPVGHRLATTRVYCDRCDAVLHLQSNSCMRTWLETGCGNFCVRCFVAVAGGLADDDTRLAGVDCLPQKFGLALVPAMTNGSAEEACRTSAPASTDGRL